MKNSLYIFFKTTLGTYGVPVDESHYKDLLQEHTKPPPAIVSRWFMFCNYSIILL